MLPRVNEGGEVVATESVAAGVGREVGELVPAMSFFLWPLSMHFLALSQAPPVLEEEMAICTPLTRPPMRRPDRANLPKQKPTKRGVKMTRAAGAIISLREPSVATATQAA